MQRNASRERDDNSTSTTLDVDEALSDELDKKITAVENREKEL